MKTDEKLGQILEGLALQKAAEDAPYGLDHGSRICRLPVKSWQADIIRKAQDLPQALNPMELRKAMLDPGAPVIFVPDGAIITGAVIDRICAESPLDKMIIWEADR